MSETSGFVLSGFADEISPDLSVQVSTLTRLGVPGLDLRSVDGINVLDLTIDDLFKVTETCREAGIHVQSIGSPVNKVPYDPMNQARELDKLRKAFKAAELVNVKRIRLFTPELPKEQWDRDGHKVIAWMSEQRLHAEQLGMTLILENDATFWSAYPDNAKRLFDDLGGPSFKAAFDFANTVLIGYRPMEDWFPWLLPHLDTLHIKDAIEADRKIVPAGEGDAQIEETLGWLKSQGWSGPLTLEPHLQAAGPMGGFSGDQLFEAATNALKGILSRLEIAI